MHFMTGYLGLMDKSTDSSIFGLSLPCVQFLYGSFHIIQHMKPRLSYLADMGVMGCFEVYENCHAINYQYYIVSRKEAGENRIYHQSLMQIEKSQPKGRWIMP